MKELRNRRRIAAIVVQAHIRGRLARSRASIVRRYRIFKRVRRGTEFRVRLSVSHLHEITPRHFSKLD